MSNTSKLWIILYALSVLPILSSKHLTFEQFPFGKIQPVFRAPQEGEERLQQVEREQNEYLNIEMSKGDEAKSTHLSFDCLYYLLMALILPGDLFRHT